MSQLAINLADGRTAFWPGETIDVEAGWDTDQPVESAELRLVWYTRGKGNEDVSVVETITIENAAARGYEKRQLELPLAPYSFSGKIVSLVWALELVLLPGGESTRVDITIAPQGREVVLHTESET